MVPSALSIQYFPPALLIKTLDEKMKKISFPTNFKEEDKNQEKTNELEISILIVDDDERFRTRLQKSLKSILRWTRRWRVMIIE